MNFLVGICIEFVYSLIKNTLNSLKIYINVIFLQRKKYIISYKYNYTNSTIINFIKTVLKRDIQWYGERIKK